MGLPRAEETQPLQLRSALLTRGNMLTKIYPRLIPLESTKNEIILSSKMFQVTKLIPFGAPKSDLNISNGNLSNRS